MINDYDWHSLCPQLVREHLERTGAGEVVEIGVWKGELSKRLLEIPLLTRLYMVDPWEPVFGKTERGTLVVCGPGVNTREMEEAYAESKAVQDAHGDRAHIVRRPSVQAAEAFADESLAVVIVDALHFVDQVKEDITAWIRKLRKGGLMIGDDYSGWFPGVEIGVKAIFGEEHKVLGQTWWTIPDEVKHVGSV